MGAMVSALGFHIGCGCGRVLVPTIQPFVASVFVLTKSQGEVSIHAQISPAVASPCLASICRGGELRTTPLSILREVCVNRTFGGSHSTSQLLLHQDVVVLTEQSPFPIRLGHHLFLISLRRQWFITLVHCAFP